MNAFKYLLKPEHQELFDMKAKALLAKALVKKSVPARPNTTHVATTKSITKKGSKANQDTP
eukprot:1292705-Prorocentrum_lima.AAC.1